MSVPLPNGAREVDGIFNLVDEAAAMQLEQYILADKSVFLSTLCDPSGGSADKACNKLCHADWLELKDPSGKTVSGVCAPP